VKVLLDRMSSQASPWLNRPHRNARVSFRQNRLSLISGTIRRSPSRSYLNTWLTADHCKVFIIDDQVAYIGGMNFGREYRYEWHDMMVEIEGRWLAI